MSQISRLNFCNLPSGGTLLGAATHQPKRVHNATAVVVRYGGKLEGGPVVNAKELSPGDFDLSESLAKGESVALDAPTWLQPDNSDAAILVEDLPPA